MGGTAFSALVPRRLFGGNGDDNGGSGNTCPALPSPLDDADIVVGSLTVHRFLLILGAVSAAISIILSLLLFSLHAFNLRNPREQIKIMRIITIIPVFSVLGLVNIAIGQASVYVGPWLEVYEGICLCTFYLLVHEFIAPSREEQATFFANLPLKKGKSISDGAKSSSAFWRRTQFLVFQSVPVLAIIAILTDVTQAVNLYCINSNKPHFAHIWFTVLKSISTTMAVLAIVRLTYRVKPELPGRSLPSQLWAFKLIVGLNVTQSFGFSIAAGQATPTNTLSYNDISVGLPNTLLNVEMIGFAVFFFKAYSWRRYAVGGAGTISPEGGKQQQPVMGATWATLSALNPAEVLVGTFEAFTGRWTSPTRPHSPSHMELLQQNSTQYKPERHWHGQGQQQGPSIHYQQENMYRTDFGSETARPPSYAPADR